MRPYDSSCVRIVFVTFFLLLALLSFLVKTSGIAHAIEKLITGADHAQKADLSQSIERTLKAEEENIRQLKEQPDQVQNVKETLDRELDAYKLQMSIDGNLLMLPTSQVLIWKRHGPNTRSL